MQRSTPQPTQQPTQQNRHQRRPDRRRFVDLWCLHPARERTGTISMHDARYKAATRITGRELVLQLLECCDEEMRKDLTRTAGGSLADRTEAEVLAAIKQLGVRGENVLLARVELYNMRQDAGEEIRIFGARICGQANLRKFTIPCSVPGCAHNRSTTWTKFSATFLFWELRIRTYASTCSRTRTKICRWRKPSSSLRPRKLGSDQPQGYKTMWRCMGFEPVTTVAPRELHKTLPNYLYLHPHHHLNLTRMTSAPSVETPVTVSNPRLQSTRNSALLTIPHAHSVELNTTTSPCAVRNSRLSPGPPTTPSPAQMSYTTARSNSALYPHLMLTYPRTHS